MNYPVDPPLTRAFSVSRLRSRRSYARKASSGLGGRREVAMTAVGVSDASTAVVSGTTGAARHGVRPRPRPRPGILLDRDGTIIVDHGYVGSVDRVEFIDGSADRDRQRSTEPASRSQS